LSYRLFEREAEREAEEFKFRFDVYPITQRRGMHTQVPTFLINIHKIDSVQDADAYIARLNAIPKLFDQLIGSLRTRENKGVIAPRFVFPLVLDACHKVIRGKPFDSSGDKSPLLVDFTKKIGALGNVDSETRDRLLSQATTALKESIKPAYEKLIGFLEEQSKRANDDAGAWKLRDGADFYRSCLRISTTTDLSAKDIHETGLKEVSRIQAEMIKVKDKVRFKGDLQAFFKFMREDQRFYLPDTEEGRSKYLANAISIIDEMKKHLGELFLTKPKADIVVKAVESFRDLSAGHAFYQRPSPDGKWAGTFYVNLHNIASNPTYQLEALAYHEGIPGHHMQTVIAQQLTGIPKFRRFSNAYTAYSEGWGLYSELTPKEIGMYQDPYSDFGRLAQELWPAARLVVDTGIHEKKWTREKAIDYLKQNTPNSEADCIDSVYRYIVNPGQATAYTIGMIKILELREKARKELGSKFDIRDFHNAVLSNGEVPLDVLQEQIERWIHSKKLARRKVCVLCVRVSSAWRNAAVFSPSMLKADAESRRINRRKFIALGSAGLGALAVQRAAARELGDGRRPYGERSPFEHAGRSFGTSVTPGTGSSRTPLQDLCGTITPSSLHFERHHSGVPKIDPNAHELLLEGLVERPVVFTLKELRRFPAVSRVYFLECAGNSGREHEGRPGENAQKSHGLLSNTEWTGVPLKIVLDEAGLKRSARWIVAEGADASRLSRSLPLEKALADVLLAYGQNGEPLRPEQGYPLRLVVPGWEGNVNIKWVDRIMVTDEPFMTRDEAANSTDLMPDGKARWFTFVMEAKSVITHPSGEQFLDRKGFYEISGLAWSGRGRITRVEVSTDAGKSWKDAQLNGPVLPKAATRFSLLWRWEGDEAALQSRCTDETGYLQPTREQLISVRGLHPGPDGFNHYNGIKTWFVHKDGKVSHV